MCAAGKSRASLHTCRVPMMLLGAITGIRTGVLGRPQRMNSGARVLISLSSIALIRVEVYTVIPDQSLTKDVCHLQPIAFPALYVSGVVMLP
jgi:hypothetical protein